MGVMDRGECGDSRALPSGGGAPGAPDFQSPCLKFMACPQADWQWKFGAGSTASLVLTRRRQGDPGIKNSTGPGGPPQ